MHEITPDLAYLTTYFVNVFFYGYPAAGGVVNSSWVLIDAGVPACAWRIQGAARERFGDVPPAAIILTHGHFDHAGSLQALLETWDVPVYAHELELPYLTGMSDYPPPDPTVGGGAMARMGKLFPHSGIDLGDRVQPLPGDGRVPGMDGWRWIHTPGHTPGHVSLFREADRALIAGDAFTTMKLESALAVLTQYQHLHGPPGFFTTDWESAGDSVRRLAALRPNFGATGHGIPMVGDELRRELSRLVEEFWTREVPSDGRYVRQPALADETGVLYVPPAVSDPFPRIAAAVACTLAVTSIGYLLVRHRRRGGDVVRSPTRLGVGLS